MQDDAATVPTSMPMGRQGKEIAQDFFFFQGKRERKAEEEIFTPYPLPPKCWKKNEQWAGVGGRQGEGGGEAGRVTEKERIGGGGI